MKSRIKTTIRMGIPETNSSSSHSVSIKANADPVLDGTLLPDENGILRIPGNIEFRSQLERYNDSLTKFQYVLAISAAYNNFLPALEQMVMKFTGATQIEYAWEGYDQFRELHGGDDGWGGELPPEIDCNASDVWPEIKENMDVIKDFIFSPESWLFTMSDCHEPSTEFLNPDKSLPEAVVSLEFDEPIGRVDFELLEFPVPDIGQAVYASERGNTLLQSIRINSSSYIPEIHRLNNYWYSDSVGDDGYYSFLTPVFVEGSLFWVTSEFGRVFFEELQRRKSVPDYDWLYDDKLKQEIFKWTMEKLGRFSYIAVKVSVWSEKFGELC